MSPARRLLIGVIVLVTATLGYAAGRALLRPSERVEQPIAFNHRLHVQEYELECDTCHEFYEEGRHAGLPTLETCLGCHEEPQTEDPEEEKILALAEAGQDDVFKKLFRIADHTYYSHQRHVIEAGLECGTCHGKIAETETPPLRPLVRITMEFCTGCHEKNGVSVDCTRCHR